MKYNEEIKEQKKYNFKILESMKRQGITQNKLAEITELHLTSIHYILTGKTIAKTGSAIKISKALNKKVSDLFEVD